MKKLFLLLFLLPNLVMAKACYILGEKDSFKALQMCKNGEQLHFSILKGDITAKASLIGKRALYCDLRYEAYIEQVSSTSTLTCIFKNHFKE